MTKLVLGLGMALASTAMAAQSRSLRFQPCSNWRYDFETSTYGCSFLDNTVQLYDKYDVDQLVRDLNAKIKQLETRVAALEAQP